MNDVANGENALTLQLSFVAVLMMIELLPIRFDSFDPSVLLA